MIKPDREAMERQTDTLVNRLKPLPYGHHPAVQGAAIAELFALWVAGHRASMRHELFEMQCNTVRDLYPLAAKHFWDGDQPRDVP